MGSERRFRGMDEMNREDVIRLAKEAGFDFVDDQCGGMWAYVNLHRPEPELPALERFADLVAAATKERCANVCEKTADSFNKRSLYSESQVSRDAFRDKRDGANECVNAIRAME